jgi:drug/metabolite transporter (DMT)-like permease
MSGRDWLLLVTLSVLWGGAFFFSEVALAELGPLTVVLGRVGFAALALVGFVYLAGHRLPSAPGLWGAFLVMGALNNLIPFSLIVWAQVAIDSGLAAILNATTPLFTVVLAHYLTRDERMTRGRFAGVVFGIAGVAVLVGPEALGQLGAEGLSTAGLSTAGLSTAGLSTAGLAQLAVLGAACCYGCAGIYGRRFQGLPPVVAAAGMVTCSAVLTLPLALVVERPWQIDPGALTWAALLGLALLSTALAYVIYFRILASAGPTNLLLVTFLIPVSALILGVVVLGERPAPSAFAGLALIFVGLAAVDGRLLRSRPRRARPRSRPAPCRATPRALPRCARRAVAAGGRRRPGSSST